MIDLGGLFSKDRLEDELLNLIKYGIAFVIIVYGLDYLLGLGAVKASKKWKKTRKKMLI